MPLLARGPAWGAKLLLGLKALCSNTEANADCWDSADCQQAAQRPCYSFDLCCGSIWGQAGNELCWDGADFTFQRCCVFHAGGGNERFLPNFQLDEVQLSSRVPGLPAFRLRQNLSEAGWQEMIPGLLFKQSYAMFRWMEGMPDETFRGRSVLELGTGIGLLSLLAAARGAIVTATDGSARALLAAQRNAEANLPEATAWNRLTWRLVRWGDVQTLEEARLAGLAPPYSLIFCSALLYAETERVRELARLLWLCTDYRSEILWGSGAVAAHQATERWNIITACFEVVEEIDAVAAGFTVIEGTTVARLRRRPSLETEQQLPC